MRINLYFKCLIFILLPFSFLQANYVNSASNTINDSKSTESVTPSINTVVTDVASSYKNAIITGTIHSSTNTHNQGPKAIDDNPGGEYYAMIALDKPGKITFPKVFKLHQIDIYLELSEENESYKFSLESTLDGKNWSLLKDFTDKDYLGFISVQLDDIEASGLRLIAKSSSVEDGILLLKEINAFTHDHFPNLRNDLALSIAGAKITESTKAFSDDISGEILLDGSWNENSRSIKIGKENESISFSLPGKKPAYFGAMQLLKNSRTDGYSPSSFEVFYSNSDTGENFKSAGAFSFPYDNNKRLAVLDKPIKARVIKLLFPKNKEITSLDEIEVLEFIPDNTSSILDDLVLRSAEVNGEPEPTLGKDLAEVKQGVSVVEFPENKKSLWETSNSYDIGNIKSFPVTFELNFYGERSAKLNQVRFRFSDAPSNNIKLNIYLIKDGSTTLFNKQPLAVSQHRWSWWKVPLNDIEADGIKIEFITDPTNNKSFFSLDNLQVIESSVEGYTSILDTSKSALDKLGFNVALSALGGRVTNVSSQTDSSGWESRNLIDGQVAGPYPGEGPDGWESNENELPIEITLDLAGDEALPISTIGINSTVPMSAFGDITDVGRMPASVQFSFTKDDPSNDHASWSAYSEPYVLAATYTEQLIDLSAVTEATGVKLRFIKSHGKKRLAIGEIAVYEVNDSTASVVNRTFVNVLQPALGGKLVRNNIAAYSNSSIASLLGGGWDLSQEDPLFEKEYPTWVTEDHDVQQSFTFAFRGLAL